MLQLSFYSSVIPMVSCVCFLVLVIWRIVRKKSNSVESVDVAQAPGPYNNQIHNPKVLKDFQIYVISSVVLVPFFIPYLVTGGKSPTTADEIFLSWMPPRLTLGIIIPTLFFAFNKNLKLHAKREFWERAPDFLQHYNPSFYAVTDDANQIEMTPIEPFTIGDQGFSSSNKMFYSLYFQIKIPIEGKKKRRLPYDFECSSARQHCSHIRTCV